MLYVLDLGVAEQSIAKQAMRSGNKIPDRIANAPRLRWGLEFYFNAFFDLDAERETGFDIGRIPWSAIRSYGEYYELDDDQSDCLLHFIKAMDAAHVKRLRANAEKK